MREFFKPAQAPTWLTAVLKSIRDALGDVWNVPLRLKNYTKAALPSPSQYKQGVTYEASNGVLAYSDGANWNYLSTGLSSDVQGLADIAEDLRAGTSVTIDWYGDSTGVGVVGQTDGDTSTISATPPPKALQDFVRTYFGNTALTVSNGSQSGGTATQLVNGTSPFSSPFSTVIAASSARAAFIAFGINDAEGDNATSAETFRASLTKLVNECRANGIVPILVTPYPCLNYGNRGSSQRAERTKYFAQEVRSIAQAMAVALVDINRLVEKMIQGGKYKPLDLLPDAVHPAESVYQRAGYTAARPLIGQFAPLSLGNQFQTPGQANVQATGFASASQPGPRFGVTANTSGSGTKSLRMIVDIEETGLDLQIAYVLNSSASGSTAINLDGVSTGSLSMTASGFTGGSVGSIYDHEVTIAENIDPGMHIISITSSSSSLNVAVNYLRVRPVTPFSERRPILLGTMSRRVLLSPKLTLTAAPSGGEFGYTLLDDMPSQRLLHTLEVEFEGSLIANEGLILHGFMWATSSTGPKPRFGLVFHLNSSGFLVVSEATSPSAATSHVQGAADLRSVSHKYRISITSAGVATTYVDDVQIGSPINLGQPYYGGLFGVWKAAAGTVTLNNVTQIFRT
jgi:lysophospholipase L1-like esterase